MPKRVKVAEEESEDEDENASGYEIMREEEDADKPPPMLQSPGKKKNVEDDIDAMVLDVAQAVNGGYATPTDDSDEDTPSFMCDEQDDIGKYGRYERFKMNKIEYEASGNVETLEESVKKAKEQAKIDLQYGNNDKESEDELNRIERERNRQIEIEREERRKSC